VWHQDITNRAITMAATAIPGMGITTTDAFIIAKPTIQGITTATATTAAIIVPIIATTMINRGLMRIGKKRLGLDKRSKAAALPALA
jgi:hypothetical protein